MALVADTSNSSIIKYKYKVSLHCQPTPFYQTVAIVF